MQAISFAYSVTHIWMLNPDRLTLILSFVQCKKELPLLQLKITH